MPFDFFSTAATAAFLYSMLATTPVVADAPIYTHLESFQAGDLGPEPNQTFFSSPIKAPRYQVNKFDSDKIDQSGHLFITGGYDGYGPSIVSSKDLSLIWANQVYGDAQAVRTQVLHGQPVIFVCAEGRVRIWNQRYELIYQVVPQGDLFGLGADCHEATLTDDGTVAMVVCRAEYIDLAPIGRPGPEPGTNCFMQEVDPVTNEVRFQFNTLDYFHVEDSFWPYRGEGPFHSDFPHDLWHMNSIEKLPHGDFLLSYRHLHSIVLLDGLTRQVKWVLGGKRSHFTDVTEGGSAEFHWQHNARLSANNRMTLFDNHQVFNGFCHEGGCSRGLEIEVDAVAMTFKMVNEWYHPQSIFSASRGGISRTANGNVLIAWGQNPMYTEHTADGELVMDIQRGQVLELDPGIVPVIAYRAWKAEWVGMPMWPPDIAAFRDGIFTNIYVSWNGATEVEKYVVLASDSLDGLNGYDPIVVTSNRTGFETAFRLRDSNATYARIAALDREGVILGYTAAVHTVTGELTGLDYALDDLTTSEQAMAQAEQAKAQATAIYMAHSGDVPATAFAAILFAMGFTV
ncbi:Uu.00g135730.m01.CDS01 [Anthostomella pinea]|uniref:Uu.00g135730.m01.CDS01 n=1 Tax=Anthostomella pinea TaxID=933095 RepID=A0AAI8VQ46_9PEZI|nr:Uu.00g135730.m01.CDS01 [Anthostomella pinea]